ncbi:MAG: UDP-N-acetylmuramate--L-alanine ligase [Bacteroidia bacterium]|nr:UDP-N-acetylmuramate--L-alanine ligase [Bacteroidia bacterium]
MNILDCKTAYFLGVGGIGMSAIARYLNQNGVKVSGYDKVETPLTKKLVTEGIDIHYTDDVGQIPKDPDIVIYTPAIPDDLGEKIYLEKSGKHLYKRAEVLGLISNVKKTIGIAGTHGKTSTSSILTYVLKEGGLDCTAFLGGIMHNYESNYIAGDGEYVVVEADEFDRSFLHLRPYIGAIMSMDPDHLDIYDNPSNMIRGYNDYLSLIDTGGLALVNEDFEDLIDRERLEAKHITVQIFGEKSSEVKVENIHVDEGYFVFDYVGSDVIRELRLGMPGRHNVSNAAVAIAIALYLGMEAHVIKEILPGFSGIQRRFDVYKGKNNVLINDYAHHPTELKAAINAARELYPDRYLTGVFQPHLFTRTRDFAEGFAKELSNLDRIILLEIYPARELPIEGISSRMLLNNIENENKQLLTNDELLDWVKEDKPELMMILGAGDIDDLVVPIKEILID